MMDFEETIFSSTKAKNAALGSLRCGVLKQVKGRRGLQKPLI
jgi:hypothetical protein